MSVSLPLAPVVLLVAILVLPGLNGCGRGGRTPSADQIKSVFPEASPTQTTGPAAGLDIYLDGSGSMKGFLATEKSVFRKTVRDLLLSATQNQFDLRVYNFSSTIRQVTGQTMSQVQDPGFYSGEDTPLATLLMKIAGNPDRTAVIVSDLVLSSRSEDSQRLVQVLAGLAAQRPQIKLLGYRSDFNGWYASESFKSERYTLIATQSLPGKGRPFYILVVAPNVASMEKVQKDLLNHLEAAPATSDPKVPAIFDATSRAFAVQGAALTPGTAPKPQWITVSRYVVRNPQTSRFETGFRLAHPAAGDTVDLPVTLTYAPGVPLSRADELLLEGEVATFSSTLAKGGGPGFSAVNPVRIPLSGELQDKVTGDKEHPVTTHLMRLSLSLPAPKPKEWNVYRIRLHPGESNLNLPAWINEWSTDDDSRGENGNKTYLLRLLVGTIESAVTQQQVCGEWILKTGGEE